MSQENALVNYDEMLAQMAKAATAVERPSASTLGVKAGILTYNGEPIKGNKIDVCFKTRREALQWGRRKVWMFAIHGSQSQSQSQPQSQSQSQSQSQPRKGGDICGYHNTTAQHRQNRKTKNAIGNSSLTKKPASN